MGEFRFDHWPVSLALLVPFLVVAGGRGLRAWAADRRARRRALRSLLAPGPPRDGAGEGAN